jgi:hypothetical protein
LKISYSVSPSISYSIPLVVIRVKFNLTNNSFLKNFQKYFLSENTKKQLKKTNFDKRMDYNLETLTRKILNIAHSRYAWQIKYDNPALQL